MPPPILTDWQVAELRRMTRNGLTMREAAEMMGVAEATAQRAIYGRATHYRRTIEGEPPRKAGGKKLNNRQRAAIRRRYANGQKQKEIAASYGISQPAVSYIINTDPEKG